MNIFRLFLLLLWNLHCPLVHLVRFLMNVVNFLQQQLHMSFQNRSADTNRCLAHFHKDLRLRQVIRRSSFHIRLDLRSSQIQELSALILRLHFHNLTTQCISQRWIVDDQRHLMEHFIIAQMQLLDKFRWNTVLILSQHLQCRRCEAERLQRQKSFRSFLRIC